MNSSMANTRPMHRHSIEFAKKNKMILKPKKRNSRQKMQFYYTNKSLDANMDKISEVDDEVIDSFWLIIFYRIGKDLTHI